jgi:hypothetical protein
MRFMVAKMMARASRPCVSVERAGARHELLLLLLLLHKEGGRQIVESLADVGVEQCFTDRIEFLLKHIEVNVEALLKDVADVAELKFGHQPARALFRIVAKTSLGHAGNAAERAVEFADAKNWTGAESPRSTKKLDDEPGSLRTVQGPVAIHALLNADGDHSSASV